MKQSSEKEQTEKTERTYRLTDDFVNECVQKMAFNDIVDEIPIKENETKEEATERIKELYIKKRKEYAQYFKDNML